MSRYPGFIGPTTINRSHSVNVQIERTINYVYQLEQAGTPKVESILIGRPGLRPYVDLGEGPVRALYTQDGRSWAVGGTKLMELSSTGTATVRGTVAMDGHPATICSNGGSDGSGGHQLFMTSGGLGYIYDLVANTLTQITADGFPYPALMGFFLDGYFGVLKDHSNQFNLSHLEDGLTWDALDVAQLSQQPGQILSVIVSHNQLWPFSSSRVNPWYDSGATFPLQPVLGADIQVGVLAPWSVVTLDNTIYWLGQSLAGGAQVFVADGYSAKRISTHSIEARLQDLPTVEDALGWTAQMDGHSFYLLMIPDNDTQLVYDAANGQWTEWAHWHPDEEVWHQFHGRCHTFAFDRHLVGSLETSLVYDLSFHYYSDQLT